MGNTRAVVTPSSSGGSAYVLQQTHYYPFGMRMSEISTSSGTENRYLYNGKELQTDFGLNWYDYGARFYDPALGRFHSVDPMADAFNYQSPFAYASNNPIRFIDFMGLGSMVGADGLTNEQWVESSRPGADPGTAREYRQQNLAAEYSQQQLKRLIDNEFKPKKKVVTAGALLNGTWFDGENAENSETSDATEGQIIFGVSAGVAKKGFNIINAEYIRQVIFNNSLRKSGMPLDEIIPLKLPKGIRIIGKYGGLPFSVWGAFDINNQYINNKIDKYDMRLEQTSNAIGAIPGIGTAWTIGWEAGRKITNIPGYHENVRLPLQRILGIIPLEP